MWQELKNIYHLAVALHVNPFSSDEQCPVARAPKDKREHRISKIKAEEIEKMLGELV